MTSKPVALLLADLGVTKTHGRPHVSNDNPFSAQPPSRPSSPVLPPPVQEAHRIGLLNHIVPCAELREKTLWLATMIAKNRREAVMGVKALLLRDMGSNLEEQWANERDYTTNVVRGARAEAAFPEFIARRGRPLRNG